MSLPSNATAFLKDAEAIAAAIPDGSSLGLPPDYSLVAMAVVRALVRRNARNLKLIGVPQLGLCADILIGAGCVRELETSAVTLGEAGLAPRFTEAAERKTLKIVDATCPMVHSGLQATEKGVPFMPMRGVLGSDLVARHPDWKTIENPYAQGDPILCVVNIDARNRQAGNVHVDPRNYGLGLGDDEVFEVHDLLGGGVYRWRGWHNYVDLTPGRGPAHVFAVRRIGDG